MMTFPLIPGATGAPVHDLQRRLTRLGFAISDPPGEFGESTHAASKAFQEARGLRIDGACGEQTWNALVEAGYSLGDRLLYQRRPMLRGDDVAELQSRLGRLGFHNSRADGMFGPDTMKALLDFQRNAGLNTDGICGPDTLDALERLVSRTAHTTKVGVHETEALLQAPRLLAGWTVFIGEHGGLAALAGSLERALQDQGAVVLVSHHPSESVQATEANDAGAQLFLGLATRQEAGCSAAYYCTPAFESTGGRRLAQRLTTELGPIVKPSGAQARGMRLPVLRDTRMPAVVCEVGPPDLLVSDAARVVAAACSAITHWAESPLEG